MSEHISPAMAAGLELAKASPTRRLYRWYGGYWCQIPEPVGRRDGQPDAYVETATVYALERRGLLQVVSRDVVEVSS